jgi:DNA polymerase (family 10)
MDNVEIARALSEVADVLEILGGNPFRVRAYRNAVRTVEAQTVSLERRVTEGAPLTELTGIGKEMAGHIRELVTTGTLAYRDELLAQMPRSLLAMMRLPGLGPKKARRLFDELAVGTVEELEKAARDGRVAAVAGFGEKSQAKILQGIAEARERGTRMLLATAERHVEPLRAYVAAAPGIERLDVAGSYRRRTETVGDIDLLAIAADAAAQGPIMAHFLAYPQIERVLMSGPTRASVVLGSGLQVDLRAVPRDSYGAALVYFTGSKEHNVHLRRRAALRGLRISEYGVFRAGDTQEMGEAAVPIAGREEGEVYAAVGIPWIPPELREDRGELERAEHGRLPDLLRLEDLRGDLQMHSTWSDGRATLEEMVAACAARGYEYMAITDHSKALAMVRGLDAHRLALQWGEIAAVQARHPEIRILKSMEIDILADGTLDLEEEMLAGLDLVVVSIHSRFELPRDEQTARILKAVRHPRVGILAHPTGRLIHRRKPIDFDIEQVLAEAARLSVAVEANSSPDRLDLKDTHLSLACSLGCKIVVSTDAHRPRELDLMRFGVDQARRAGLTAADVLNTLPLEEFLAAIRR